MDLRQRDLSGLSPPPEAGRVLDRPIYWVHLSIALLSGISEWPLKLV